MVGRITLLRDSSSIVWFKPEVTVSRGKCLQRQVGRIVPDKRCIGSLMR